MTADLLTSLSNAYEATEAAALALIRDRADHAVIAIAVRRVAEAAAAFQSEAYRRFHAREEDAWMPLDHLTERTEVLADLWADLASAYEG